jgi:hypothetical protein
VRHTKFFGALLGTICYCIHHGYQVHALFGIGTREMRQHAALRNAATADEGGFENRAFAHELFLEMRG